MENAVTEKLIQSKIKDEMYMVLPDGRTTLCILTLENGYTIQGLSACVDANNFDLNVGRMIAHQNAMRQIWPLEGYLLAERLFKEKSNQVTNPQASADAPYGYKKDGTPRKPPGRKSIPKVVVKRGPGRPRKVQS